jgi:hypothetical protein
MAAILSICKVSVGTGATARDYYFQGSNAYTGLEAETGVSVIAPANWIDQEPLIPVGNLVKAAKVERKVVEYTIGSGDTAVNKTVSLVIAKDKIQPAEDPASPIKGKTIKVGKNTGKVKRVRGKRDKTNRY